MNMLSRIAFTLLALALASSATTAQTPAPIVVQAVPASASQPAGPTQPAAPTAANIPALKTLEELKATNADILTKQAATLSQLEEIQKAAEQIRIYTKRG